MRMAQLTAIILLLAAACITLVFSPSRVRVVQPVYAAQGADDATLDSTLVSVLSNAGFTGNTQQEFQQRLEANLGRPVDPKLANLGRMLWFDKIHSLHHDNTCGGCHSPTNGFGDSQPMAIGVQNNNLV